MKSQTIKQLLYGLFSANSERSQFSLKKEKNKSDTFIWCMSVHLTQINRVGYDLWELI